MQLRSLSRFLLFSFAFALLGGTLGIAAPSCDTLLPNTTKGFLSVTDTQQLESNWNSTMLGQLANDEVMKPFIDDLQRQLQRKVADIRKRVGLSMTDLKGIASGEVSLSTVLVSKNKAAIVLMADVTDRHDKTQALLAKIDKNLSSQKAVKTKKNIGGVELTTYTLPPLKGTSHNREIALFVHEDILCTTDSSAVAASIIGRFSGNAKDSLLTLTAYQSTMARCARSSGPMTPDIRWFAEPFGYVEASRLMSKGKRKRHHGKDMLAILKRQGFDAILGLGGYVNFYADGKYELLHRTSIFAPAVANAPKGEKYRLAMRMINFPSGGELSPQTWIPREIATYVSFQWDIKKAFESVSTLANEFIGEDGFETVLRGIEKHEFGAKVDIRNDLIAHLEKRVTIITDYAVPITTSSERFLFSVETNNPKELAETIRKLMESDTYVKKVIYGVHTIWVFEDQVAVAPGIQIEGDDNLFDDPYGEDEDEEDENEDAPTFPNSCVCVAHGQLLFASNIEFMKKILNQTAEQQTLGSSEDFNQVKAMLKTISPNHDVCLSSFSRTDEEYRPTYELLRQGKMPQSKTLLGRILNEILTEDEEEVRSQKFDGSKLPNFEIVRRYFGPAGVTAIPEDQGWFIVGAMIRKDAPNMAAKAPNAVTVDAPTLK